MNKEQIEKLKNQFQRNELGLLDSIDYVFNEDNTINWRKMIKPEFLVPNRDNLTKKEIDPTEAKISDLEDKDLLILLGGIKELARIRGFESVTYPTVLISEQYVCATCSINWIGNYETDFKPITFQALADAHIQNTTNFASAYLAAIAENRAFVRCVRNFLKINIVGQEEVVLSEPNFVGHNRFKVFNDLLRKKKISFLSIKKELVKEGVKGAENYKTIKDIPSSIMMECIAKIKKSQIK